MKMNADPDWIKSRADAEDGCIVSVGGLVEEFQKALEDQTPDESPVFPMAEIMNMRLK